MNDPRPAMQTEAAPRAAERPRLAFAPIASIERLPESERWLVDGFISAGSLTVLGAAPKTGKTWVCLALAAAVASGRPAMGRFAVGAKGRVMMFPAEDDPRSIRERMEALCVGQGIRLEELELDLITEDALKLDDPAQRHLLEELLRQRAPRLLILDPLVRLHSGAESSSQHMSELFGYLRRLCRQFGVAIIVTHHLAKSRSGSAASQPGQAMRGSGDVHASYDHGCVLARMQDKTVQLTLEHRAAPSPEPVCYRLVAKRGGGVGFVFGELPSEEGEPESELPPLRERVFALISAASKPVSQVSIRKRLRVRNANLTAVLRELQADSLIENLGRMQGWRIVEQSSGPAP